MNVLETVLTAFTLGAASATHCLGMCGVFVLTATGSGHGLRRTSLGLSSFFAGKLITYGLIGAIAGWFGMYVVESAENASAWLGLLVAATLLVSGIALLFGTSPGRFVQVGRAFPLGRYLSTIFAHLRPRTPFVWGLLSSFLPCGVVYLAALQSTTQGDPFASILFMVAFGVSTAPALSILALAGSRLEPGARAKTWRCLSALLLIGLGVWMTWRSIRPLWLPGEPTSCCH